MNELIQKLAEESGLDAKTMGFQNNHTEQWNARVSKLTQLIVQQCIDICANGYQGEFTVAGISQCVADLKEHFGVDE